MAPQLKYVMVEHIQPVIFLDSIEHKQLESLGPITSAGFLKIMAGPDGITVKTYGHSHSLKMEPNSDDASIIELFLNTAQEVKI